MSPRTILPGSRVLHGLLAGALAGVLVALPVLGYREGPLPDRVGACGFGATCRESGCHAQYPIGSSTLAWTLEQEPPAPLPAAYVPGSLYRLRLEVADTDPAAAIWGFELGTFVACPVPSGGGDVQPVDASRTRRVEEDGIAYLTHSCLCPSEDPSCCGYRPEGLPGRNGWTFDWTAPGRGSGDATFYMAFNAGNWDGTPMGDRISLADATIPEEACPPVVEDLRVRLAACDPGEPGAPRVELAWSASGAPSFVRTTTDRARLPLDRTSWTLAASPSTCLPIDGAPITYYSVAGTCALGSEADH